MQKKVYHALIVRSLLLAGLVLSMALLEHGAEEGLKASLLGDAGAPILAALLGGLLFARTGKKKA